jgi:PIN domain nuclease of toxin-antitoxin system
MVSYKVSINKVSAVSKDMRIKVSKNRKLTTSEIGLSLFQCQ